LFTVFFIFLPIKPTYAQENVWRLTETIINPDNEKLELHGGGSDPAYYAEERYKGNPFNAFSYSSPQEDAGTRVFTDEEFEKIKADVASLAPTYWGDDYQKALLKEGFIGLIIHTVGDYSVYDYSGRLMNAGTPRVAMKTLAGLQPIRVGDTIRTGEGSAKVVIFPRYWADKNVIRIGTKSEVVFTRFGTADQDISVSQTLIEMVRGWVRVYIQNWARGAFDVRVGTTLIGIRGSDVLIIYNPEDDIVAASVCEGHMDVTSTRTDQTVSLTDGQIVLVSGGVFEPILPMTQQDWDEMVGKAGVEDITPLSAEEIDLLLKENMQPVINTESEQKGVESGVLVLIIVLVVIAAAAISTGIYLLIRSRRKQHAGTLLPADTSEPSPGFCSHCGSAISQGSIYCKTCGSRI
jgi:hypothetical protein